MRHMAAYAQLQTVTLGGEQAFEELYTRLARWTGEAADCLRGGDAATAETRLEKCVSLLGYMDRVIDLSQNYEIAAAILSLHRFAIGALVKAKAQRTASDLAGLPQVFLGLAEIFAAMAAKCIPHLESEYGVNAPALE
ncbi:MAG TPA: flagellar protein FliS [Candidatus Binataceae bacterium]|nr:flagellar protein FliS [Candidatus Binataceae bacterium]